MAIMAGSGREQSNIPLEQRLADKTLRTPGKSLHFFNFDRSDRFVEIPPYSGPVTQDIIEQTPAVKPTIREKLWQYRGGAAIVAAPGDVLPKVYGTTIVQGRVIWASDIYLDENSRPRIDVAYGLAEGTIGSMLKIYGGNDKQLLYGVTTLEGAANGVKYWKKVKLMNGSEDQLQSNIIKSHEGGNNTPRYRGLAYAVFRGLKLYKFNRSAPDLWFVIGRQIDLQDEDEYADEPTSYDPGTARQTTSMTGDPDADPLETVYCTSAGISVYEVDLGTNTWTDIGNSANLGGTNNKVFNTMRWFKGNLYLVNYKGLWRYNGTPQDWTQLQSNGNLAGPLTVSPDGERMVWYRNDPLAGVWEFFTYDGNTITQAGNYNRKNFYSNSGALWITDLGEIYSEFHKSAINTTVMYYDNSTVWQQGTLLSTNNTVSAKSMRYDTDIGRTVITGYPTSAPYNLILNRYEWVGDPQPPGQNDSVVVFNDNANRVTDLEKFSQRYHVTRSVIGGTQALYRVENDDSITTMPSPPAQSAYYTHIVQRIGKRLFVGTTRGFWEAGDAS